MLKKFLVVLVLLVVLTVPVSIYAAPVTSPFGWRIHPVTGEYSFHSGIDIGYEMGDPVVAMRPGKVVYAAWYGDYGNCVILEHEDGDHTLYGHCSSLTVNYGDKVDYGSLLGYVGDTGNTTGPHLHLEWWHNGEYADPMGLWE